VGPEHSFLKDIGRAEYYSITDEEALEGNSKLVSHCRYCICLGIFLLLDAKNNHLLVSTLFE